jgi:hypothetical protein
VLPHNSTLFQICFMAANGPLVHSILPAILLHTRNHPLMMLLILILLPQAWSILAFNQALVLHQWQQVVSVFIHVAPMILTYGLRCYLFLCCYIRLEMLPLSLLLHSSLLLFNPILCTLLASERLLRSRPFRFPSSFAVCTDFPTCSDTSHMSLFGFVRYPGPETNIRHIHCVLLVRLC